MCTTRVATMRRDGARPWGLAAPHIVHAVTPYRVEGKVVLFILAVILLGLLTAISGNLS